MVTQGRLVNYWPSACPRPESLLLDSTPLIALLYQQAEKKKKEKENKLSIQVKGLYSRYAAHQVHQFLK